MSDAARLGLSAIERPASLFAGALAGGPVTLAVGGAGGGPPPGMQDDAATLWLTPQLLATCRPLQPWGALRLALLRQLLRRRPAEAERHLRATALAARTPLLRRVFAILDGGRIDAQIEQRYPGARPQLRQWREQALAERALRPRRHPLAAIADALQCLAWQATPQPAEAGYGYGAPELERVWQLARGAMLPERSVDEVLYAAVGIVAWLDTRPRRRAMLADLALPPAAQAPDGPAGGSAKQAESGDPSASAEPGGRGADAAAAAPGAPSADGGSDGTPSAADSDAARRQGTTTLPLAIDTGGVRDRAGAGHPWRHPEWDYHLRRYRPGWAWVHELRPVAGDLQYLAQLRQRHSELAARIRRRIGKVRAPQQERVRRRADGDEIDLDAAIEAHIDRQAGLQGDDRVYSSVRPARRDVCAAFLLDISGSTGFVLPEPGPSPAAEVEDDPYFHAAPARRDGPPQARRRVIDVAKDAIGLMCDALTQLGDRHAIYAFSGEGRLRVDFHVAKRFDEDWSAHSAAALAALEPQGSTRTGAALRHASRQLQREQARVRFLILVTDGYPQDRDYGPDPDDVDYGLRDTAMAMREAERAGIAVFCVCIDHAAHDHLRRAWPAARYLVIDEIDDLPEQLSKVYRRLVAR